MNKIILLEEDMENTEDSNQLSETTEKEIVQTTTNLDPNPAIRKQPLESDKEKRQSKLVSMIASQLPNIPTFVEELKRHGEIALDISQEMAGKLANGDITFGTYTESGVKYAQFVNSETGRIFKNIPIKELPSNLGPALATAGLSIKLQEITYELGILGEKVDRVNRNFDLNRYAEVQSAKEKYEMAMLTKDPDTKKALLLDSLTQATNAKNLFLNQLLETKVQLANPKSTGMIPIFSNNISAADGDRLAMAALENLTYMKDAFSYQIAALFELSEFDTLNHTIYKFKEMILQDFSGEDALFLDEHLSVPTNPFKFLSNNIVAASNSMIDFLNENEELLDVRFIPDLLEIADKREMSQDGN